MPIKNKHVLFQEMKNNPVHLITEEDLKQISILESINTSKKDKKDERRRKATGNKLLTTWKIQDEFFIHCRELCIYQTFRKAFCLIHLLILTTSFDNELT